MVASHYTMANVIQTLRKHLDDETIIDILQKLKQIDGNKSFKQTIERMIERMKWNGG